MEIARGTVHSTLNKVDIASSASALSLALLIT